MCYERDEGGDYGITDRGSHGSEWIENIIEYIYSRVKVFLSGGGGIVSTPSVVMVK